MKKKIVMVLLVAVMTTSVIAGCGKDAEGADKVQAAMVDAENEMDTVEPTTEHTPEATVKPEPAANDEPTTEPVLTDVNLEEPETNSESDVSAGSVGVAGKEGVSENSESTAGSVIGEEGSEYTYKDMEPVVMYAKSNVNLRDVPSTNGEKVGKLVTNQEVLVTGKCIETGWYRIELEDGEVAYVSNKYIVSEKVSQGNGNGSSSNSGSSTNQNTGTVGSVESAESGTSKAFVDYLNQQRASLGLPQLTWDENLAAEALRRAQVVSGNFSHDGKGDYGENLYKGCSSSVSDWYTAWYNSDVHKAEMLRDYRTNAGCAFYKVGEYYYVVYVATGNPIPKTLEELQAGVASGEVQHYDISDGGSIVDVYIEGEGGIDTNPDQGSIDAFEALRQQYQNGQ